MTRLTVLTIKTGNKQKDKYGFDGKFMELLFESG
jgi:hypothetical protein